MPFDDLLAFFDPTLPLPIGGRTYTVRAPDHETGLRLVAWQALAAKAETPEQFARLRLAVNGDEAASVIRDALGVDVYDAMHADCLPLHLIHHAGQTAFLWIVKDHCKGTEVAGAFWAAPGKAQATTPTTDPSTSTSTAAESTTPSRRRGSGTTSRRKSSPAKPQDAPAAPAGPTS